METCAIIDKLSVEASNDANNALIIIVKKE